MYIPWPSLIVKPALICFSVELWLSKVSEGLRSTQPAELDACHGDCNRGPVPTPGLTDWFRVAVVPALVSMTVATGHGYVICISIILPDNSTPMTPRTVMWGGGRGPRLPVPIVISTTRLRYGVKKTHFFGRAGWQANIRWPVVLETRWPKMAAVLWFLPPPRPQKGQRSLY